MHVPMNVIPIAIVVSVSITVSARGDLLFSMSEVDGNVVLYGSGSLDTTGMRFRNNELQSLPLFAPGSSFEVGGPASTSVFAADGTGPTLLRRTVRTAGDSWVATSGTGDLFGLGFGGDPRNWLAVTLPEGYASGTELSGSASFDGESFDSMRLATGDYVWMSGVNTIRLSVTAVPEPRTCIHLAALSAVWFLRRRRAI